MDEEAARLIIVAAAVALDAQKTVLQQPAFQVIFELPADEPGKVAASTFDLVHECGQPGGGTEPS